MRWRKERRTKRRKIGGEKVNEKSKEGIKMEDDVE